MRVAKCLVQLPKIDEAFASGAVSYSKVRAMIRSASRQNEAFLLNIARHGTAHHVEMLVRKHHRVERLVQADDDLQGNSNLDAAAAQFAGRLTPEDGALLIKAIDGAFVQLFPPSASSDTQVKSEQKNDAENVSAETFSGLNGEPGAQEVPGLPEIAYAQEASDAQEQAADTFPQKRADALMLLVEQSLQHNGSDMAPLSPGAPRSQLIPPQRHQMIIHIEKDSLTHGATHHCSIEHGRFLSPASAEARAHDQRSLLSLPRLH